MCRNTLDASNMTQFGIRSMTVDNFSEKAFGTFSFRGYEFSHVFTNVTRKLAKIDCFKYESRCKSRKTVVLDVKFLP